MSRGHSIVFGSGSGHCGNIMWEWWGGSGGIYLFLNRDWVIWCRAGGLRGGVFRSWWWERRGVEGEEVRGRKRGVGGVCGLSKLFYFFVLGSQKYICIGEALRGPSERSGRTMAERVVRWCG